MKVWIENPFDNLACEGFRQQRYSLMAQAFRNAGHDAVLWTSDFNHTTKLMRNIPSLPDGIKLVKSLPYSKNISVRRILSHMKYASSWENAARENISSSGAAPDIIIASTPTLFASRVARKLAKEFGARFILDIQDLWPETFERVIPTFALAPLRAIAKANILAADRISAVADAFLDSALRYGCKAPMRRFYHGIELDQRFALTTCEIHPRLLRFAYVGNLGVSYHLQSPIQAILEHQNWTLDVAGKGAYEPLLRTLAASCPERVRFHGYLDKGALSKLLAQCDIGIVPLDASSRVAMPYKFADYSRAGLAILSSLPGESAKLLEEYSSGDLYSASDKNSFSNAAARLQNHLKSAKLSSLRMARELFDASRIYREYVSWSTQ